MFSIIYPCYVTCHTQWVWVTYDWAHEAEIMIHSKTGNLHTRRTFISVQMNALPDIDRVLPTLTSFPGSLMLPPPWGERGETWVSPSSPQGAVRWETLGTRLQKPKRFQWSTFIPWNVQLKPCYICRGHLLGNECDETAESEKKSSDLC